MRINYKLDKEDYYEFNLHHMSHFKKVKRSINSQRFLMPILFIVIGYFVYRRGNTKLSTVALFSGLGGLFWITIYPKVLQRGVNKRLDLLLSEDANKSLLEDKVLIIKEDGLYEEIIDGDGELQTLKSTEEVLDVVETDKNIYIYLPKEAAYIIPKKFLEEDEKVEFLSRLDKLRVESDKVG